MSAREALAYVPVEELDGRPHLLVDGAARPGSVLTLSHWPQSPTPPVLARDLSAGIAFALLHAERGTSSYRGRDRREVRAALAAAASASCVTNDHFDEDGTVAVHAFVDPDGALRHEGLLCDVASCGDFGVVRSRTAARICFAIGGIAEAHGDDPPPRREGARPPDRPGSWSGGRYRAVLERLPELLDEPERYRAYWRAEDAALDRSLAELRDGSVVIEEVPEIDLAVVRRARPAAQDGSAALPAGGGGVGGDVGPAGHGAARPLHEVALHSATAATRILAIDGDRIECYLRYETWVRFVSRKLPLRPDLAPLAERLGELEPGAVRWEADGVGAIITGLRPVAGGRSELDPAVVEREVAAYLRVAPGAWDPFRIGGGLVPAGERRPVGAG